MLFQGKKQASGASIFYKKETIKKFSTHKTYKSYKAKESIDDMLHSDLAV